MSLCAAVIARTSCVVHHAVGLSGHCQCIHMRRSYCKDIVRGSSVGLSGRCQCIHYLSMVP